MKKSATKVLVAVLCLSMVLGTSMSAMAAVTSIGNTDVAVNFVTGVTTVRTTVTTDEEEKVTYMVHDAADFYSVKQENVKYIDQKTINITDTFEYTTSDFGEKDVVYVGGESLENPQTSNVDKHTTGLTIKIDEEEVQDTIKWEAFEGYVKVPMANAADVTAVTLGADATETNFAVGNGVLYVMLPEVVTEDLAVINIETVNAGDAVAPIVIKAKSLATKLTPNEFGVIDLANMATPTTAGFSGFYREYIAGNFESDGVYSENPDDNIKGTYQWTVKMLVNGDAVKLLKSYDASTNGYVELSLTENDATKNLRDDVDAVKEDIKDGDSPYIVEDKTLAELGFTEFADGAIDEVRIVTVKKGLKYNVPSEMVFISTTGQDIDVYVPAAGQYQVLACYNNGNNDTRCMTVTVGSQTNEIGEDGTGKYIKNSTAKTCLLDSGVFNLEKGKNTVNIKGSVNYRWDFIAFIPVDKVESLLTTVNAEAQTLFTLDYATWSTWLETNSATASSGIKLGYASLSDSELIVYAKVASNGFANCGIKVTTAAGTSTKYEAYGVKADGDYAGAFAVALVADSGLVAEFEDAEVSAYVDGYSTGFKVVEFVEE